MTTSTYPGHGRDAIGIDLAARWGQNVREAREAFMDTGITQARLADRCGITQQSLSQIEHGETIPRDGLKVRLAQALGVPIEVLFSWEVSA